MAEMNNYTRTVRSYEISIWTLQDRFLSVLKWATQDQKGQLQDPEMVLRDDGTQELSFSIPKFYWVGPTRIENPMWLHLEDQPLEANMHKLKVIFNKESEDEEVFEFLVVSVEHNHSGDMVQLNIKAEGLAFHELGKIGYRIKFSQEEFKASMDKWIDEGMNGEMPQENLQYWNDLLFKDANGRWKGNWRYEVRMDWSSYSHKAARSSEVVYEDEYVSSWHVDDSGVLSPRETELHKEKWRAVEASESNLYNITQTIAEEFGIFCRYEYEHDDNYHILPESYDEEGNPIPSRKVIYYNNYYYDIDGHADLTYPYTSSAITRTVDSSNITTKLYVNTVDYDDKKITIMDVEANKSNEDYLLNFDYLHEIQAITEEQYAEVERYEAAMHIFNKELSRLIERKRILDNQLIDISARVTLLTNSVQQDKERMDDANRAKSEVTSGHEDIPINQPMTVIKDTNNNWGNYITTTRWPGLNESSIQLYENSTFIIGEKQYSDLIRGFTPIRDENNMISHLVNIARTEDDDNTIYLQATYNPYDYYEKLAALWQQKKDLDTAELDRVKELELMYNWYLTGSRAGYARVDYMLVDDAYYPVGIVCVSDDMDNPEPWSADATRSDRVGFMRVLENAGEAEIWLAQDPKQDPFADLDIETSTPDIIYYLEDYLKQKAARFNAFEKMMGPAMREGYWSPEEYHDYGDKYRDSALIYKSGMPAENKADLFQTPYAQLIWDSDKYFSGESAILYDIGVEMRPNPHLTIDLSECLEAVRQHLDDLCFIYADPSTLTALKDLEQSKQELIQKVTNTQPLWRATNTSYINRVPFNDATNHSEFTNIVNKANPNGANDEKIVKLYKGYTNIDNTCKDLKPYYTKNNDKEIDPRADSYTLDELSNRISELTALKKLFDDIVVLENESPQISGYSNRCTWSRQQAKLVEQLYTHLETDFYSIRQTSGISIPSRIAILKENIYRVYRIKADCELGWVKIEGTNETSYKPVLFVTGADELDDESIDCIMTGWYPIEELNVEEEKYKKDYLPANEEFHPCLGLYETIVNESGNDVTYKITRLYDILWQKSSSYESRNYSYAFVAGKRDIEKGNYDRNGNLRWPKPEDYYIKRIYPRIYFNTLKVKNNSDDIKVSINNSLLTNNDDYYCVEDDRSKGLKSLGIGYYLTFRPEVLYSLTSDNAIIDLIYSLSNVDTAIYLDALKVMRENAYPKVSYNVELSVLNPEFIHRAYDRLNQIVYINDNDLNLDDVSGYISSVTMHLDKPWEDQVEIKNYETKFEDLFSTIVAQTEAMKKSAGGITAALQAFSSNGLLTEETITNSLANMDLNLAFNSGKLSISERDGIWALSGEPGSEQALAIRGGGIFTSTEKDENGNWIWNTAILPSGINANLITAGQLDTNKIKIYAGNEVRFQLNGDGLFAYKPFNVENEYMQSAMTQVSFVQPTNGIDSLQYVVYNSDGLALVAKRGTWYRDSKETQIAVNANTAELSQVLSYKQTTQQEIKRVEVSWDGFILRNWQNEKVFYADPDTGNLTLKGAISADSGDIGQWRITPRMLTGHGIHLVSVEDSSDSTETGSAGIYLTDKKDYIETEIIDGVSYYIYIDDNGEEFYSQEIAFDHHSFAAGKQIYRKFERLNTVIPKYLLSVFESKETAPAVISGSVDKEWVWNEEIHDSELVIHANPTVTQNNVETEEKQYIVTDAESTHSDPKNAHYALDINNDKISFDGNISPASNWYDAVVTAAKEAQDDYTKYITELTYKIYEKVTLNAALSGHLKTNPSVQFSVKADTGEVYIKQGEIGNYSVKVNSDDTTTAILHSSLLTKDNAIIADKNKPDENPISLGKLFYEASFKDKQLTLTRVDQSKVNFNIAGMQWYKDAISAASKITLTLTFSNGKVIATAKTQKDKDALDNPSDSGIVVETKTESWNGQAKRTYIATATSGGGVTVQRTLTLEPTGASSGEGNGGGGGSDCASCTNACSQGCNSNCGGGCKNTCKSGCKNTCFGYCVDSCNYSCSNGCTKQCADYCKNSCGNDCGGGCKGSCGKNCVGTCSGGCYQSCTSNCGSHCGSGCSYSCSGGCRYGCGYSCNYNTH